MRSGGELDSADGEGQLPWSDDRADSRTEQREFVPGGSDDGDLHGDGRAGQQRTCSFTVTVSPDAQAPVIAGCPANIGPVAMDAGVCGAAASWTAPTVTDNCPGATIVADSRTEQREFVPGGGDDGDLHRDGRAGQQRRAASR